MNESIRVYWFDKYLAIVGLTAIAYVIIAAAFLSWLIFFVK